MLVFLFLGKNQHEGEIQICFYQIWEALAELYCFSFLSQEKMRRFLLKTAWPAFFGKVMFFITSLMQLSLLTL